MTPEVNLLHFSKQGQRLSSFENSMIQEMGALLGKASSRKEDFAQQLLVYTKGVIDTTCEAVNTQVDIKAQFFFKVYIFHCHMVSRLES